MRTPDFNQFLKVLNHEKPDRPVLFELFFNPRLNERFAGPDLPPGAGMLEHHARTAKIFRNAGYDYATISASGMRMHFPANDNQHGRQTKSLNEGAVISDRASFDAYPWPDPEAFDLAQFGDALTPALHGIKLLPALPLGLLENVLRLVGYDALCYMLADDPLLATDIFESVGSRLLRLVQRVAPLPNVGAILANDDWGFRTQTLLSVADMRKYVFPWHKQIVATAHNAGKPAVLHSCGFAGEIMRDIIHDMKFNAKHSFEDVIEPVERAYEKYGRDIALLGGMDVDFIVNSTPDEIRARARNLLALSEKYNNYALGTGNSVADYVPDEHYFAMVSAAFEGY